MVPINTSFVIADIEGSTAGLYYWSGQRFGIPLSESDSCQAISSEILDSANPEIVSYYKEHTTVPIRNLIRSRCIGHRDCGAACTGVEGERTLDIRRDRDKDRSCPGKYPSVKIPYDAGVEAYIVDVCNKISLIGKETCLKKEDAFGPYFSVFPLGGIVEHFSLEGAKYPLCDHTLCPYDSLCVSNQIQDEEVRITFPKGLVILMETRDEESVCFC